MKKTIAKCRPVFLVESNSALQKKVAKLLKKYLKYYYNMQDVYLDKIKNLNKFFFYRFSCLNSLSKKNIFCIHQNKFKLI